MPHARARGLAWRCWHALARSCSLAVVSGAARCGRSLRVHCTRACGRRPRFVAAAARGPIAA
eukprot:11158194-Alexandrium_andersonii.AAC.1